MKLNQATYPARFGSVLIPRDIGIDLKKTYNVGNALAIRYFFLEKEDISKYTEQESQPKTVFKALMEALTTKLPQWIEDIDADKYYRVYRVMPTQSQLTDTEYTGLKKQAEETEHALAGHVAALLSQKSRSNKTYSQDEFFIDDFEYRMPQTVYRPYEGTIKGSTRVTRLDNKIHLLHEDS